MMGNGHFDDFTKPEKLSWQDLFTSFDWDGAREEINQESRGRIVITGLSNAGKSTLLNHMCGWSISKSVNPRSSSTPVLSETADWVEDYGLFCLIDLPETVHAISTNNEEMISELFPLELAAEADLIIYVLDGAVGARPIDYRWIGQLRRQGKPFLVVLNKSDLLEDDLREELPNIEAQLATSILPVSATKGTNVLDKLVSKIVDANPKLAVPLGRELKKFRRQMANRIIHNVAVFNGIIALEPMPLLDLPLKMMMLVRMMTRIATVYENPPTEIHRKEIITAMAGGILTRYLTQTAVKFIPVAGWVISASIAASTTWALGQGAVVYFEVNGDEYLRRKTNQVQRNARNGLVHSKKAWCNWVITPFIYLKDWIKNKVRRISTSNHPKWNWPILRRKERK